MKIIKTQQWLSYRFVILFLTFFCVSTLQAESALQWLDNLHKAERIHKLITRKDSSKFDRAFPNSTFEEVSQTLKSLKSWLKYLRGQLAADNFFFPGESHWGAVEEGKREKRKQILALEKKISELKAKKELFKPKLTAMERCKKVFQKINPL